MHKVFQTGQREVVAPKDINLDIPAGYFLCLLAFWDIQTRIHQLLDKFGLLDFRIRFPKYLSGSMRQRATITCVLVLDSPILLRDEPFGALDALTRRNFQVSCCASGMNVKRPFFIMHSIAEAIYPADCIVVMTYEQALSSAISLLHCCVRAI